MYSTRNTSFPSTPATPSRWAAACALILALWLPFAGRAQEFAAPRADAPPAPLKAEEDPGYFEIREAKTELEDGVYFLDARIEYRLSSEARSALQSGLPLTIRVEVELLNNRRFWFDNEEAALRQRYQLEYHALSERFTVQNLNSGDQTSFSTLYAALDSLGHLNHLPLIDSALLESTHDYYLRMRAVLDAEKLPGPLRLIAFWRRDWSLGSDWYQWQLRGG
jgi:Domain of unknown function (DUF4390)